MSSQEDTVRLLPTIEELAFLDKLKVGYTRQCDNYVTINKNQFMKKVAA